MNKSAARFNVSNLGLLLISLFLVFYWLWTEINLLYGELGPQFSGISQSEFNEIVIRTVNENRKINNPGQDTIPANYFEKRDSIINVRWSKRKDNSLREILSLYTTYYLKGRDYKIEFDYIPPQYDYFYMKRIDGRVVLWLLRKDTTIVEEVIETRQKHELSRQEELAAINKIEEELFVKNHFKGYEKRFWTYTNVILIAYYRDYIWTFRIVMLLLVVGVLWLRSRVKKKFLLYCSERQIFKKTS